MEDIIIKKLCNLCMNKNDNCMKYTCENYIKDETKVKGYEGKWIDNTLANLEKINSDKEVTNENNNPNHTKVKEKQSADSI